MEAVRAAWPGVDNCPLEPEKPVLPAFMELDCLASAPLLDDEGTAPFETGPAVDCDCCGEVGADAVFVATGCWELPLPVDDVVPGGVVA